MLETFWTLGCILQWGKTLLTKGMATFVDDNCIYHGYQADGPFHQHDTDHRARASCKVTPSDRSRMATSPAYKQIMATVAMDEGMSSGDTTRQRKNNALPKRLCAFQQLPANPKLITLAKNDRHTIRRIVAPCSTHLH